MFSGRFGLLPPLLFLCLMISAGTVFAAVSISSSPSTREVTVDGKWTTVDEWSNATELQARGRAGYICIKDDASALYILIDFVSDTSLDEGDLARVRFDVNNDQADRPQADDYMVLVDWVGGVVLTKTVQGNGTGWVLAQKDLGLKLASTSDSDSDPYSDRPHLIYEFAIPRGVFGDRSETGFSLTVGHKMRTSEARFINLPRKHHFLNPFTWATLSFATPSRATTMTATSQTSATTPTAQTSVTSPTTQTSAEAPLAQRPILIVFGIVAVGAAIAGIYLLRKRAPKGG